MSDLGNAMTNDLLQELLVRFDGMPNAESAISWLAENLSNQHLSATRIHSCQGCASEPYAGHNDQNKGEGDMTKDGAVVLADMRAATIDRLSAAAHEARKALEDELAAQCPGPHVYVQFRSKTSRRCPVCGYTEKGQRVQP